MYEYCARVTEVYDGDTITVDIDLGFGIVMHHQKVRLFGINTPELRGVNREQGLKSRDALRERVLDKTITLRTHKDKKGKFGRWLGELFVDGENVNEWLIEQGLARGYVC